MSDWDESAAAWIACMGDAGDATRAHVIDAPMISALPATGRALDIGCGEGRFCRAMQAAGLKTVGIDPTDAFIKAAQMRDPDGHYIQGRAESLPLRDGLFDMVVFYLSLIDIRDFAAAISEAARVLKHGGRMLVANLHAWATARPRNWEGEGGNWAQDRRFFAIDDMMSPRANTYFWSGISIQNYHRPLSAYMTVFLESGLQLSQFFDPPYTGADPDIADKYQRMPWAFMMVWDKPEEQFA